jgi:hypothetical protein
MVADTTAPHPPQAENFMHDGKTPGRRRFLGLAAAGAGAVVLAGLGELAFAADETPVRTYRSPYGIDRRK